MLFMQITVFNTLCGLNVQSVIRGTYVPLYTRTRLSLFLNGGKFDVNRGLCQPNRVSTADARLDLLTLIHRQKLMRVKRCCWNVTWMTRGKAAGVTFTDQVTPFPKGSIWISSSVSRTDNKRMDTLVNTVVLTTQQLLFMPPAVTLAHKMYEGDPVNRSQMEVKQL
jgi:hypothetical protein